MIKWLKAYVMSIRKDIVILLILDCAFLLLMELVLRRIPAPFPIFVKIGNVFVTLGISFLASFIFYFVQVHLPEIRQKKNLNPVVSELFNRIIVEEKNLLMNYVNTKPFESLSEDIIRAGVKVRDVNLNDAPLLLAGMGRNANWMEYGFHQIEDIDKTWEMLMKYTAFMDSELISILSRIQSDTTLGFFRTMKGIYPSFKHAVKLNGFESGFVDLWRFIIEQDTYFNTEFSDYKK